jgi:hypothetical protein
VENLDIQGDNASVGIMDSGQSKEIRPYWDPGEFSKCSNTNERDPLDCRKAMLILGILYSQEHEGNAGNPG